MKIKYTFTAFLCLLMLSIAIRSSAQIGLKAGIGVSDIVFSDEGQAPYLGYETDYLTHRYPTISYQIGVSYVLQLNRHFDFQPELLFTKQGLNYSMDLEYDEIANQAYLYYLQIPMPFRYSFCLKKQHHPNFFLGPYFGLLLHSKRIKTYDGQTISTKVENAKPYDFGLVTGFGYDFKLKKGKLITELRFGYSLINVLNEIDGYVAEYDTPDNLRARNVSTTLLVGYRFDWSEKKK